MKNKISYIVGFFVIVFLFTGLIPSFGQQPLYKSFDIRSENTRPRILKLFLDHNGLIWAGTDNGIFTFDGINFIKIYSQDTVKTLVSTFFEDHSSNIWVGYENGDIIRIKNNIITPFYPKEATPKAAISGIAEDDNGRMFFSTKGEGVICAEGNHIFIINQDNGLSDGYCYEMKKLDDNRICLGTDAGLNLISFVQGKISVKEFGTSDGLPDDVVRAIAIDKNNMMWVGFQENGLAKYDCNKNKLSAIHLKHPWKFGQVNDILIVDDQLWIATEENGIVIIDRDGYSRKLRLDNERTIKPNDLLLDFENNVWIAESIHLYRTSGNKITFLQTAGEKSLKFIHCIASDKKGGIWFSPDQKLGHLYRNSNGELNYNEYPITEKITDIVSLYFDPYGFLWIGTLGEGVFRFNPSSGKLRKITETTNASSSNIMSINGTKDIVWIAGFNSVMKFIISDRGNSDDAQINREVVFTGSLLLNDYVYSVFLDSKGDPWFATDGNGVFYWKENSLKNIPVFENAIHSFAEDEKGRIWFTTADAGLQFLDVNKSVNKFQTRDGLSDPSPTSILCMKNGELIIVHANGFDILNPDSKRIIYHSSEENLSDINCDLNSLTISPDSNVWIGTERGIIIYKPSADIKHKWPKVVLHSVSVFLEKTDLINKRNFDWDENNLRFDYYALWYSDPQRVNYQYILDGYSSKWELTKDHTVTFPKLPPGKYVFRIKASLNGIFDKAEEISYTFEITPPYWQRLWFRLIAAGIIVATILLFIRRRDNRLRKFDRLQKEKIEFQFETLKSQVNPHFLFNSFNTLISVIENTPKNAVEYVEKLSEFFRNIVTFRDKNLIRVSEELSLLDNYIFIQKKRYGNNLRLEILMDENSKKNKFVAPLTLQLLAENAIKHNAVSKESPLTITITSENDKMIVSNNINLKITPENSTGLGLQNIKSRYELLTDVKVEVYHDEEKFKVIIPLITVKNESTYN